MIHCVNLNATQDLVYLSSDFSARDAIQADKLLEYPGGKGNNAARMAALWGAQVKLHAFCSRESLKQVTHFQKARGVFPCLTAVDGSNRPCVILTPLKGVGERVINSPSQLVITRADFQNLKAKLEKNMKPGDVLTLSGSLPRGVPEDAYAKMIRLAHSKKVRVLLDSYGPGLRLGIQAHPFLIKPNLRELSLSLNVEIRKVADLSRVMDSVLGSGVEVVVVTLGDMGAVLKTKKDAFFVKSLPVKSGQMESPVGCGDAFFGTIAYGIHQKKDWKSILKEATAAAFTNLGIPGAVFMSRKNIRNHFENIRIQDFGMLKKIHV